MKSLGRILSIQSGRVQTFDGDASERWSSAIRKAKVSGAVQVRQTGIVGDAQADLVHHGGPDKAILAYADQHYDQWNAELPGKGFDAGGFGENLTVADLDESQCCIGDTFRVGECVMEISQPRQPCWKLSRRWDLPKLTVLVQQNGRTGWYLRVIEPGQIEAGMTLELLARPFSEFSVQWANAVMYAKPRRPADDQRLSKCPALSEAWRTDLEKRSQSATTSSEEHQTENSSVE
ncbi:MAG: MOSC domain-containing protein [Planctomycetaceae bacterium]